MQVEEQCQKVREWHAYWCDHLENFAACFGVKHQRPKIFFRCNGTKIAGTFRPGNNTCYYSVPYVIACGNEYYETVAHEVCHSYQYALMPKCKPHGDFFLFLMRQVCKFPKHVHRHNFDVRKVKKIARYISPHAQELERMLNEDQVQDIRS